ncbi:MAG: acetyl-CoA C-acetyltransferase [Clostridia bacterium]|nr:MAG: acetyl-CoA C-acetyltransferase [Clostridia bacterium]
MASVIVGAARTAFGRFSGALKDVPAVELGAVAIKEAVQRAGIGPDEVDYCLMGMVLQGGAGQIPSRQATVKAGLPVSVPSDTVNKVCISGLRTVVLADMMVRTGEAEVVVAGGMESMSNAPYLLPGSRWGYRMNNATVVDMLVYDGLTCAFYNVHMGVLADRVAAEYGITRADQDVWALRSHQRAIGAMEAGLLAEEIVPVTVPLGKGKTAMVAQDEGPRRDTSAEKLAALPPAFVKDTGTVTAGNAPGINDGAAAVVVMSEDKARQKRIKPLARILGHASVSAEPAYIATVPGLATNKLLQAKGMSIKDITLIENNEAFASVPLISGKITGWDLERVNVNGGAVAFGHPIGASGTRIIMALVYELRRRGGGLGIATICGGAAQGEALLVEAEG